MTPEREPQAPPIDAERDESAEDLFEHAPCAYLSTRLDGRIVRVNQTFLDWTGLRREDLLDGVRFQSLLTAGGRIYHETHYAPLLRMQGTVDEIALEVVCADGARLPVLANSALRRDAGGEPVGVRTTLFKATDRKAYERELLLLRRREQQARERTEQLQALTAALAAALNPAQVAAAVIAGVRDALGGAATFAVADAGHALTALDAAGDDPPAVRLAAGSRAAPAFDERAGTDAVAQLPLVVDGRLVGMLAVRLHGVADVGADDRAFLVACAQQAAQALQRARRYEEERRTARVLQHSMLPAAAPADHRFRVATRYQPAVESLEVGGDWYDVFCLGEDRLAIGVGDVVGRGIEAATAMGQLRSAVRALAGAELAPAELLTRLDGFAEDVDRAQGATLVYAEIALDTGVMRYACAGHPPPLLLPPSAPGAVLWEGRSVPLGFSFTGAPRTEAEVRLEPGARVLLYTDGVVERRDRSLDDGFAWLLGAFEDGRRTPIDELVDDLARRALGGRVGEDDTCLLSLELCSVGAARR